MDDLEFVGKIKGMKTLKQMIESKEVIPASERQMKRLRKKHLQRQSNQSSHIKKQRSAPVRSRAGHFGRVSALTKIDLALGLL